MVTLDRKKLEIMLEGTPSIINPKKHLEQYETPPVIASKMLWEAFVRGDLSGKSIADLGCGGLRLSIGTYILGAYRIIALDIDEELQRNNMEYLVREGLDDRINLVIGDARNMYLENINTVVMNPPFGVVRGNRGIDILFLKKAMEIAGEAIYTIHKWSPSLEKIVVELADTMGFNIVHRETLLFPLKAIYETHIRKVYRFKTVFYILRRRRG